MLSMSKLPRFTPGRLGGRLALLVAAAGFVAIGLGYNGAAGNTDLAAQLPYLVSGGFMGVSLVVMGAALLVVQGAREDRQRLESLLVQLVEAGPSGGAPVIPSVAEGLYATGTASYHRPDCRLVEGRDEVSYLTAEESQSRGLKACRVCQPDSSNRSITIS